MLGAHFSPRILPSKLTWTSSRWRANSRSCRLHRLTTQILADLCSSVTYLLFFLVAVEVLLDFVVTKVFLIIKSRWYRGRLVLILKKLSRRRPQRSCALVVYMPRFRQRLAGCLFAMLFHIDNQLTPRCIYSLRVWLRLAEAGNVISQGPPKRPPPPSDHSIKILYVKNSVNNKIHTNKKK